MIRYLSMMVRELVLLWMVALVGISAQITEGVNESNKTLSSIPANYPSNITKLILRHNRIVVNSSDIMALRNYTNLTELDLSYNLIAELPADAFSTLSNLESLSLLGNKLQTLSNKTVTDLSKLKKLDLSDNPWICSKQFLNLIKWINNNGVQTGANATCETPQELAGKSILNLTMEYLSTTKPTPLTTKTHNPHTTATSISTAVTVKRTTPITTQSLPHVVPTTSSMPNISKKDSLVDAETGNKKPGENNTWKFLTGVIAIILCTSIVIVCAVKSPSWYKMIFNYRHQRLREAEDPRMFNTGRYSNFSLDTEQTETSVNDLDQGFSGTTEDEDGFIEDGFIEDGFIEDGYIQPGDYKDPIDVDEV
ncbi:leucine-rich repeat-containing protein 19-like isoform X1 [Trichomycterus rosablanca]|uniref:leucine-rich repeat-containing protein 19-like isoform X1 n=2 Tax=Trichomycterus rosablanca TaxID=2290929 RepID=UPI002F356265